MVKGYAAGRQTPWDASLVPCPVSLQSWSGGLPQGSDTIPVGIGEGTFERANTSSGVLKGLSPKQNSHKTKNKNGKRRKREENRDV
ncbi:hypothetical protein C9439_03550 [archaeon SCG-AAA382B04]|nr:hypothetical protein C9439_03550 [archaeon SCG-AAA382B04]